VQTCKACGESGEVRVTFRDETTATVLDFIPHKATCQLAPRTMPGHLRNRRWAEHEKHTNARMGIRGTLASGSVSMDGDGRQMHHWRLECKQTASRWFTLTQALWAKLVNGALLAGEEPVLDIEFTLSHSRKHRVVVMREALWNSFRNALPPEECAGRYRVFSTTMNPEYVGLNPPGIAVDELDFLHIKEQLAEQLP